MAKQRESFPERISEYTYTPLPLTQFDNRGVYIRLMRLLPKRKDSDSIEATIEAVRLSKPKAPYYEALSYTWGSRLNQAELHVIGDTVKTIAITQSLREALLHLRSGVPRTLWIDAICINQASAGEKSEQVSFMTTIW
jgi:hypothetical protein